MKGADVRVSDHAVLRYLERAGGFDIEGLRRALAERVRQSAAVKAGALKADGVVFVLSYREGSPVVTTVLPDRQFELHVKSGDPK